MPRANPVAELAQKLQTTLEHQRQSSDYPLTVQRLAALADPQATPEQITKALNKKPFAAQWIVADKKDNLSPISLAADREQLAASPLLLEFALGRLCRPETPLHTPAKVVGKVEKALRPAFQAALERAAAENRVPSTVGIVWVKKKPLFYLQQFPPLPPPPPKKKPAEELSEKLVRILTEQRDGEDYPLPLDRLYERADATATATVRKQALGKEPFRSQALLALPKAADSLVALVEDRVRLLASPRLLHGILTRTRTPENQILSPADLVKKLPKNLQIDFRAILQRHIGERGLPEGVGLLFSKKKPLLFLLAELDIVAPPPPPPHVDFSRLFEEAFARLDRERGGHNHVSLVELRRAVPMARSAFDAGLQELRRAGRYSLSAAEGRHGIGDEERENGITEDGSLLLFVSRRA